MNSWWNLLICLYCFCISSFCMGRLFGCVPQIIQPLLSTLSMHVPTSITGDKPTGRVTNKMHPDHSRNQKCCPLLCTHPLHSIKCSHFVCCSSFFGSMANLKLHSPRKVPNRFSMGVLKHSISFIQFLTIGRPTFYFFFLVQ